jgi:hypothetical protein
MIMVHATNVLVADIMVLLPGRQTLVHSFDKASSLVATRPWPPGVAIRMEHQ